MLHSGRGSKEQAMAIQNPVIVIPGITASSLRDSYEVNPETVWGVLRKDELRAALHPDDLRYELIEPARVEAEAIFRIVYGDLIEELRSELSDGDTRTPVYPFAYDWRMPLEITAERLGVFIEEVIGRTSLLRHYHRAGYHDHPGVDVVAHSMGGLVLAGYLSKTGKKSRVGRVVTIATPFRGSIEAPIKVTTGTAELGETQAPNPRDRFGARLTPALYHLLPEFDGAVEAESGITADLFQVDAWQPSVFESIGEAVALYGPAPAPTRAARREAARGVLQAMLDDAKEYRRRIDKFKLAACEFPSDRWLCLVGVDAETRVTLPIRSSRGKPYFDLHARDRANEWSNPDDELRVRTGDGTVPFLGALPSFLPLQRLVCLRPRDFGYWEVRDRLLRHIAGFHGTLPMMNLVHRLAAAFLLDEPRRRGIGGWRPPGVSTAEWDPPLANLPDRSR
jgi:pimeloyl-ACP methyl ester carboxylesterase